ncbi:TlpA family protein disulfide reductase [Solitalea lacus]|uniref:TlpA family protein disulfide reductase n=1 Tax=Solitalea lacus TaxID=2911172 RepID=UPI001EDBFAE9|nr:TlpA disulfide reductase family protein [Solitalea lacus]UKJ09212.1 TlpA family protein disulfide reductase [Solitalea lacus]
MKEKTGLMGWVWPVPKPQKTVPQEPKAPCRHKARCSLVIGMLCCCISVGALAQGASLTKERVSVGTNLSDVSLTTILNFPLSSARLSDFKGKAVILDFWATWCGSCVSAMPKLQALQGQFAKDLQVLLVTNEEQAKIASFLLKVKQVRDFTLPVVLDRDHRLWELFNIRLVPQYAWIDRHGIFRGVTTSEQLTPGNIQDFVSGNYHFLPEQAGAGSSAAGGGEPSSGLLYSSTLSGYQAGSGSNSFIGTGKVKAVNCTPEMLFRITYGQGKHLLPYPIWKTRVIRKDSLSRAPKGKNTAPTYGYELNFPGEATDKLLAMMRADLERYFPLTARLEQQAISCLALRCNGKPILNSTGGPPQAEENYFGVRLVNHPVQALIETLQSYSNLGILDETGISSPIDIELKAELGDLAQLQKALAAYHLELTPVTRQVEVLVIKDRTTQPN